MRALLVGCDAVASPVQPPEHGLQTGQVRRSSRPLVRSAARATKTWVGRAVVRQQGVMNGSFWLVVRPEKTTPVAVPFETLFLRQKILP